MRHVVFKKYIQPLWETEAGIIAIPQFGSQPIEGTGVWINAQSGIFHEWGHDTIETEHGITNQSVAIVEDNEGSIHLVKPSHIRFLNSEAK